MWVKFEYKNDSLHIFEGRSVMSSRCLLSEDTMSIIDTEYKGSYMVFYSIKKAKQTFNKDKINEYLINKTFEIDVSKLFIMRNRSLDSMIDKVVFEIGNKIKSKSGQFHKWELIKSDSNLFLCLDDFMFQLYDKDNKGLILKGYYEKEHTFRINLIN